MPIRFCVIVALLALGAACTSRTQPPDEAPPPGTTDKPRMGCQAVHRCDNVIDRILVDMLAASGRGVAVEDSHTLCRRAAIDLTGAPPTALDYKYCDSQPAAAIIGYFMDKPSADHVPASENPYLYVSRRAYADLFRYYYNPYDPEATSVDDILQLDRLVTKLYAGDIGYDTFAVEALATSGFLRRFGLRNSATELPSIAAAAYRIFLGREALPSDAADFGNLWRPFGLTVGFQGSSYSVVLRGGVCDGAGGLLCQSTVLGPARVTPGISAGGSVPINALTPQDAQEIRKPGRLIVARREFAEALVDRVLQRYLGWWNAGTYRPDYNLPAVRQALADFFIDHHYRIRDLELEVLTSLLYTQPQTLQPGELAQAPLWSHGPLKPLPAEVFLDSLAAATRVKLGGCDFRFPYPELNGKVVTNLPSYAYTFPVSPSYQPTYYTTLARKMGGCPIGGERSSSGSLMNALTKRDLLVTLCRDPNAQSTLLPQIAPGTPAPDGLRALLRAQFGLLIGRAPTAAQEDSFAGTAGAAACPADTCNYRDVSAQLCMALLNSSLFNYY